MDDLENEAPFTIPESAFGPFRDLVEMGSQDFEAFISGLSSAEPTTSIASLSRHIGRSASRVPKSVINAIVSEIITLEHLKEDSEMSVEAFASAISASALDAASDEFDFEPEDAKILFERLSRIFSAGHVLELNTKAVSIVMDHHNLFLSGKILTDARPVFNEDGSKIEAFAIVHMLRIHYERSQSHKDFFVALDTGDIPKLRRILDRAETKAKVLQKTLKATQVSYLDMNVSDADH